MIEIEGDIWTFYDPKVNTNWIVVPTNGEVNRFGNAIMGRGVAKQCADRIPLFSHRFGKLLREKGNRLHVFRDLQIITFPVKYTWRDRADLNLITRSTRELGAMMLDGRIYLPRVGCGNGRLCWSAVLPILQAHLTGPRFTVVHLPDVEGAADVAKGVKRQGTPVAPVVPEE